jgi:hypothetical protein
MRIILPLGLALLLGPTLLGCGPEREQRPVTHKVSGTVVQRDGTAFTKGGVISFQHDTNQGITSRGEIKPDGTFRVYSLSANHKVDGAQEGPHSITILPASDDQQTAPLQLRRKYIVEQGDNNLTIALEY